MVSIGPPRRRKRAGTVVLRAFLAALLLVSAALFALATHFVTRGVDVPHPRPESSPGQLIRRRRGQSSLGQSARGDGGHARAAPPASSSSDLADDPFCASLQDAVAKGSSPQRKMIHVFVSNSGHLPLLRNALRSMIHNDLGWKSAILSLGAGVCPSLEDDTDLRGRYVCVPYLDRLVEQLGRDEPESMAQISDELKRTDNATNASSNNTSLDAVDATVYKWGSVGHKFLINAKLYALRDVLACGADAFVTDTDIGFRRDPRPYFDVPGIAGDVVAQNDTTRNYELSLNSGFMYWRATASNLDLINDVIKVPPFWHIDQARVNTRMYKRGTPHTLLDRRRFPNGKMFQLHNDELDDNVMMVFHANFNDKAEEKEEMLRKMGMWYLNG